MKPIFLSLLFICFFYVPSSAQCSYLASYQYDDMKSLFRSLGYSSRKTYNYGSLSEGQKTSPISRRFYTGNKYVIGAVGDDNSKDIDIYVYDKYYNLVVKESSTSSVSAVEFYPKYSGTYYVVVKMYDTYRYGDSCYTLVYGYR